MNLHHRDRRKIDPTRGPVLPDGTPNDGDRVETGPTRLARDEWAAAGVEAPDVEAMRRHRWERLTAHVVERGWGGILLFDPLNIRYASDHSNMQLWNAHNPFRALLLLADGHMVLWDYKNSPFLADHLPLIAEVRSGAGFYYFGAGDRTKARAESFAGEVRDLLAEHAGAECRLGVDKIMSHGLRALEALGIAVEEGEEAAERARAVKGPDEIAAMRCAIHAGERCVAAMHGALRPGITEDELWSVLHAESIRRGGEWIETRLLASGPRTNPWFQECGPRVIQPGEVVGFDTDLVGCYGMCVDISRSWWVGPGAPRPDMGRAMRHAREHIDANIRLIEPGMPMSRLTREAHRLAPEYRAQRYGCIVHGVGLCDEWPCIVYPEDWEEGAFDHVIEPGMTLCVEALVGEVGGDFSIKLEDQVLVTKDGVENLTRYPFDAALTEA
jgi:Xaa-Pro aminopeptidase